MTGRKTQSYRLTDTALSAHRVFSAYDNNLQSLSAFLFTEASRIALANFSQNDLSNIDHRAFLPASPRVIDLSHNDLTRTQFFSWTTTEEVGIR